MNDECYYIDASSMSMSAGAVMLIVSKNDDDVSLS